MITEQTKSYSKKQIYKTLHPWVRQWFDETFEDFTPAQKKSIVDIHKGNNILVSSPTGSGKTLTAFLSILSEKTWKNLLKVLRKLQARIWELERPSEQVIQPNIKDRKCLKSLHIS